MLTTTSQSSRTRLRRDTSWVPLKVVPGWRNTLGCGGVYHALCRSSMWAASWRCRLSRSRKADHSSLGGQGSAAAASLAALLARRSRCVRAASEDEDNDPIRIWIEELVN